MKTLCSVRYVQYENVQHKRKNYDLDESLSKEPFYDDNMSISYSQIFIKYSDQWTLRSNSGKN